MNRKSKVRSIVFICIVLVCAVVVLSMLRGHNSISEDAVLVMHRFS